MFLPRGHIELSILNFGSFSKSRSRLTSGGGGGGGGGFASLVSLPVPPSILIFQYFH